MGQTSESLLNADTAFSNRRFEDALEWYRKALTEDSDNIYALSRAGAICVSMGQFDSALEYFRRAKALDPQNGDNHFNYANACFFKKDLTGGFASYVEAEKRGCSEDVTPRLFYQMALLCSLRQDTKSALIYFKKCEDSDTTGNLSLSPDLISEKLKLFMQIKDYSGAEKAAAQLVAIQPTLFRNYMVYYSILLAHKKFPEAEKLLQDAARYAELSSDDKLSLVIQNAALLIARGNNGEIKCFADAVNLLQEHENSDELTADQKYLLETTLAEAYTKAEMYDDAINYLLPILSSESERIKINVTMKEDRELSEDDIEIMIYDDMDRVQEAIDQGEIDPDLGFFTHTEYDEDGYERHVYNESVFSSLISNESEPNEDSGEQSSVKKSDIPLEIKEKMYFTLLSAYLGKDDFAHAKEIASILKNSNNKYYTYYGIYVSALSERKLNGDPDEVDRKYAEAIAYFRSRTFENHGDSLALVFRARLYAEQGKREKAEEIANLLSDDDRQAILDYCASYQNN